jgi:hypothetical protein
MSELLGTQGQRIAAWMLSCPGREALRQETLANLGRTDWGEEAVVVVDVSEHFDRRERLVHTCRLLLRDALAAKRWDYLLFLEDDLVFNLHLRHNLQAWWPLRRGKVQLASLYNPGVRYLAHGPSCAAADPETVYGSQAFLISRACAAHLLKHYDAMSGMQDIRFSRLAARLGPIYYHTPSLVQHVGRVSAWGGQFHEARDFDLNFRA